MLNQLEALPRLGSDMSSLSVEFHGESSGGVPKGWKAVFEAIGLLICGCICDI